MTFCQFADSVLSALWFCDRVNRGVPGCCNGKQLCKEAKVKLAVAAEMMGHEEGKGWETLRLCKNGMHPRQFASVDCTGIP